MRNQPNPPSGSTNCLRRTRWVIVLLAFSSCMLLAQRREVVGYYPSWKWNRPHWFLTPDKIPYEKLTIINYAFFVPTADGRIVGKDSVGDRLLLGIPRGSRIDRAQNEPGLVDLAHRQGVSVLPSLGGWEDSNEFPAIAKDMTTRAAFAHACLELIDAYGFDGIDVDWEYPCFESHKGTPDDKQNFTRLMKTMRDSLDAHGLRTGKRFLLTAALPATPAMAAHYEMQDVARILDHLNLMTYDLSGEWDPVSGHNAPLYRSLFTDSVRTVDDAFRHYTQTLGIPPSKLMLGAPFYAHSYMNCGAMGMPHAGADTLHFSPQGIFYHDIVERGEGFIRRWDDAANVPYLVHPSDRVVVSYDDEASIAAKCRYVREQGAAGLIIWELTGDRLADGRSPLMDVIHSELGPGSPTQN